MNNPEDENFAARLATLAENIRDCTNRLADAHAASSAASKQETAARNLLNSAHKDFDDAVKLLRKAAPRGTDWAQRMTTQEPSA